MPSISKTKSGERFRAPTDQARKADRKRENKRNKKDRQQIRHAMAKFCNVDDTINRLLALERQVLGLDPQPFHVDVLKKKQKVLTDAINKRRVALQQAKEEDELTKFNNKLQVYHADCRKLAVLAEQAQMARDATLDSIPLPMGDIALPPREPYMGPNAVKKKVDFQLPSRSTTYTSKSNLQPPGPPCGVAPDFSDSEDEDDGNYAAEQHVEEEDLAPVPIPDFNATHRSVYQPNSAIYRNPGHPILHQRMPHPYMSQQYNPMGFSSLQSEESAIISSAPQINKAQKGGGTTSAPATLSAAPELRNLRKETVKLVPVQLLRHTDAATKAASRPIPAKKRPEEQKQAKSTDEAYNDFMKELDGLI